jgi:two-component system OmpR family response regulator
MVLVSGERSNRGAADSSVANVFGPVGSGLMTKVLLIEDDSETAEEISAELSDRGFEVEWSPNGVEGLDKARSTHPDAMIADRLLPGMDGLTVIETLRKEQVRTPVLVLSALGAVDDRVRGLRMGGDDYLTKPFALVELVARVEALLRRPAESRETILRVRAATHIASITFGCRPMPR